MYVFDFNIQNGVGCISVKTNASGKIKALIVMRQYHGQSRCHNIHQGTLRALRRSETTETGNKKASNIRSHFQG